MNDELLKRIMQEAELAAVGQEITRPLMRTGYLVGYTEGFKALLAAMKTRRLVYSRDDENVWVWALRELQ